MRFCIHGFEKQASFLADLLWIQQKKKKKQHIINICDAWQLKKEDMLTNKLWKVVHIWKIEAKPPL